MTASKTQPALLGGLFIGVLSALPVVNFGNCCCCLWVVAGGALAAYLLQQDDPVPISTADAATVGLMAGVVGAIVGTLVSIPMNLLTAPLLQGWVDEALRNADDMPPEWRHALEGWSTGRGAGASIALGLLGFTLSLVIDAVFATIGGAIGVVLFRRTPPRVAATSPVPPLPPPPAPPPPPASPDNGGF
jgi:hypothetical protein